uniref:Uncharacterized protein n=1 Tax=Rhipicephalus zambeziensis TaxID=60191 RepID=A0A224Y7A6_9ACAR
MQAKYYCTECHRDLASSFQRQPLVLSANYVVEGRTPSLASHNQRLLYLQCQCKRSLLNGSRRSALVQGVVVMRRCIMGRAACVTRASERFPRTCDRRVFPLQYQVSVRFVPSSSFFVA